MVRFRGVLQALLATLLLVALISWNPADPSLNAASGAAPTNWLGAERRPVRRPVHAVAGPGRLARGPAADRLRPGHRHRRRDPAATEAHAAEGAVGHRGRAAACRRRCRPWPRPPPGRWPPVWAGCGAMPCGSAGPQALRRPARARRADHRRACSSCRWACGASAMPSACGSRTSARAWPGVGGMRKRRAACAQGRAARHAARARARSPSARAGLELSRRRPPSAAPDAPTRRPGTSRPRRSRWPARRHRAQGRRRQGPQGVASARLDDEPGRLRLRPPLDRAFDLPPLGMLTKPRPASARSTKRR